MRDDDAMMRLNDDQHHDAARLCAEIFLWSRSSHSQSVWSSTGLRSVLHTYSPPNFRGWQLLCRPMRFGLEAHNGDQQVVEILWHGSRVALVAF